MQMGRSGCNDANTGLKRGPWTPEEDQKLLDYIQMHGHGHGSWRSLPEKAGLQRCGKSCRLRWINYLRPDIKRGNFSLHEINTIIQLHALLGNRWSAIASYLPKRTDNEIKNYWNTHIKKRLTIMGVDPNTHRPMVATTVGSAGNGSNLTHMAQWESARLEAEARLVKESSKLRQLNDPGLPRPPRRRPRPLLNAPARCLDILKAWQRVQLKSILVIQNNIDIDESSSSINHLQYSPMQINCNNNNNNNNNLAAAAAAASSLLPNQVSDGMEIDEAWNIVAGDEEFMKGFSNLAFDNSESCDHHLLIQCSNCSTDHHNNYGNKYNGNRVSEDNLNDEIENNNYWDDILVDCGL